MLQSSSSQVEALTNILMGVYTIFILCSGVIPFVVLSYLNANVYIVIRRRRQHLSQRFMNAELNNYKAETTDAVRRALGQILYN